MYRRKQFLRVKSTEMRELDFNFETFVGYTHIAIWIYIFFFIKINIIVVSDIVIIFSLKVRIKVTLL